MVGDFTDWNQGEELSHFEETGIWTGFFEGAKDGDNYKFRIIQADGTEKWKVDPFGFEFEVRPSDASVLKHYQKKIGMTVNGGLIGIAIRFISTTEYL